MRVVRICGIDEEAFTERFEGGAAMMALKEDLRLKDSLGIWALPAFLVECGERSVLIRGVVDGETLTRAVISARSSWQPSQGEGRSGDIRRKTDVV